jgi:hypothetical protein
VLNFDGQHAEVGHNFGQMQEIVKKLGQFRVIANECFYVKIMNSPGIFLQSKKTNKIAIWDSKNLLLEFSRIK